MTEAAIDLSEFKDDVEDTNLLASISAAADQLKDALEEVEKRKGELAAAEHTAKTLSERIIPELMERAKMESFRTSTGLNVSIGEKIQATIPKAKKPDALGWMKAKGYGNLIRTEIVAEFDTGKEAEALALFENIRKLNTVNHTSVESNIHPSTFRSWAIKRLEEGIELPSDLFSIFRQRQASLE